MSVLDRFARPVGEQQVSLARRYVDQGAVEIRGVTQNTVEAVVRGNEGPQETRLDWSGVPLDTSCTCNRFARAGVCDHVIATALAAEAGGIAVEEPQHAPRETMPRRRGQPAVWLSPTGQLKQMGVDDDERRPIAVHQPQAPSWKKQLTRVKESMETPASDNPMGWPADRQILYVVDVQGSLDTRGLMVRLAVRDRKSNGEWSRPKTRGISFPEVSQLTDAEDQRILTMLKGASGRQDVAYDPTYNIPQRLRRVVMEPMAKTGRTLLRPDPDGDDLHELKWDEGAWELWMDGRQDETAEQYVFSGSLRRGEERVPLTRATMVVAGGLVFFQDTVGPLEDGGAHAWVNLLRQHRGLVVPLAQGNELLGELFAMTPLPRLDLPEDLRVETIGVEPKPHLRVRTPKAEEYRAERLRASVLFNYDGVLVGGGNDASKVAFQSHKRRLVVRDKEAEKRFSIRLHELGLREAIGQSETPELWFNQRHLPRLVKTLVEEGWHVEANDKAFRRPGKLRLSVSSGIDWFELRGDVDFGDGRSATLSQLLAALRKGETSVALDDGTFGMLPDTWLKKYGVIATIAQQEEDHLKFATNQVGLLDALLASQEDVAVDEVFEKTRGALRRFEGVDAIDAPQTFRGELRPYQREGLGWFEFLQKFGFGGCLADDMGLGKTVQVLALLESRRPKEGAANGGANGHRPSLVVVPKSLVFNWRQEAERFTPALKILDHTGIDRLRDATHVRSFDAVITTYGTLRRDAAFLKDIEFDFVILDEAQAVKNPASESAKAVRLVKGRHRLALSGTPVQNHLGDLWSLFDFLNPGMLGAASVFSNTGSIIRTPDPESRGVLARALRPFILRRTKEQVAKDLPPKLEQTLYCELEAEQRKMYNDLRDHYRRSLLDQVEKDGLGKYKMQILEALLRLRQAALHPGLIDKTRTSESSAKLDLLLPQLSEVIEEGHKALVFSQFTSMLAIVRERLDKQGIVYEYLDGKTRDRQERVDRFQKDEGCKLFLISLKAGGLGLNLTAADYVFLLDPWWNPAVEAQAIDRAHRIGQTKQVYACRLIAKDTVEEKVLALQQSKRDLADAIITEDNSLLRTLGREELELLLS